MFSAAFAVLSHCTCCCRCSRTAPLGPPAAPPPMALPFCANKLVAVPSITAVLSTIVTICFFIVSLLFASRTSDTSQSPGLQRLSWSAKYLRARGSDNAGISEMRSRYDFDSSRLCDTSKVRIQSAFRTSLTLHARISASRSKSVSWYKSIKIDDSRALSRQYK